MSGWGSKPLKTRQIPFLTLIAYCNINMSIRNMKLGEKIRYLREVEGSLRGLGRPMTQQEMVKAVRQELRKSISQSYLSQIESGARPHMTQSSRALLAKFFKVHPGFLVDDPEGYHTELTSDLRTTEGQLDVWLLQGSERFAGDARHAWPCRAIAGIAAARVVRPARAKGATHGNRNRGGRETRSMTHLLT